MSTSRAIWPRALRLSRAAAAPRRVAPRRFSARAAACLLVLTLAGLMGMGPGGGRFTAQLAAQQDDAPGSQDVALLTDGPELARGLPFFAANVIPHYRGGYEYRGNKIEVFYTENEIVRFSGWQAVDCGNYRLYRVSSAVLINAPPIVERPVFLYQTDEYSLFIRTEQQYLCTFFPRFMRKFVYFRSVQEIAAKRPPFPALVD